MVFDEIRNSGDITAAAIKLLPVNSAKELAGKMSGYKTASPKLIRELVRAVNVESQYRRLKNAGFDLSKAANLSEKPIDADEVLRHLDHNTVGDMKAASLVPVSFKKMTRVRKAAARVRKTAAVAYRETIQHLISKAPEDTAAFSKIADLKMVARARKAAAHNMLKAVDSELTQLLGNDRRIASLTKTPVEPGTRGRMGVKGVVKWAELNRRRQTYMEELELINMVLGDE